MARILIVDDDVLSTKIYLAKLNNDHHEVVLCQNGQDALAKIITKFDLVLLDIMMPKMDGIALLKEIQKGPNRLTPVLVYTNLISKEVKQEALANGAKEFLLKADYSPAQILAKFDQYLPRAA